MWPLWMPVLCLKDFLHGFLDAVSVVKDVVRECRAYVAVAHEHGDVRSFHAQ